MLAPLHCFLQFVFPVTNHRYKINGFCCSINYKMREVKQHRYLQIQQLIFDTQPYTHNLYLTQCQSILMMVHLCILTPISRHPSMASENKKINIKITTTMKS